MAENWKSLNRRWHANIGMFLAITMGLIAISCPFIAHKGGGDIGKILKAIHFGDFLPEAYRWIWIDSQGLGLAFLVFSGWLMHKKSVKRATNVAGDDPSAAGSSITFVGLGEPTIRDAMAQVTEAHGYRCFRCDDESVNRLRFDQERWMVFTAGGNADPSPKVERLLKALARMKSNQAKRLQYTLDPTLPESFRSRIISELQRIGARPFTSLPPIPSGSLTRTEKPSTILPKPLTA